MSAGDKTSPGGRTGDAEARPGAESPAAESPGAAAAPAAVPGPAAGSGRSIAGLSVAGLSVDRRDPAAWILLDRAEAHNAFNAELIAGLSDAVATLGRDPAVRAVVIAGRGASFSAGADLAWMRAAADWSEDENRADAVKLAAMLRAVADCPKPVIARVHGAAVGGGVGLAAAADICLAGPKAWFQLSEVKLGLSPATIGPHVLDAMGVRAARRYWLTAERIAADEALALGLVHALYPDDAALDAAIAEMVALIAATGPVAAAETKALIADLAGRPNDAEADARTAALIARLRAGPEAREGLAAFFEKRPPAWR